MLLFSLLNLRITKNAVNIGTYSLEFPVVIFEIMVSIKVFCRCFKSEGKIILSGESDWNMK